MAPYETLYERRCRSPIGWLEVGEAELIRSNLVYQPMEKAKIIQESLTIVQSRYKSYTYVRRRYLEFEVHKLRTKEVALVQVLWRNQFVEEATSEAKEDLKKRYTQLFPSEEI
ncbi:hypothetical protein MTR67_007274 [Solanum verrucosum]|uniref:Uncharacterized protein n=1 Tax=Solanum verrucosum TaxID=315347 RepID=A0AAF0PZD3_SOLVR|nr:hypothetical protein MTR67_007274 [Solanum verrucosum]